MTRLAERANRRLFLTYLGSSVAGVAMLGCTSPPAAGKIGQRIERGGAALLVKEVVRRTVFSRYSATSKSGPDQVYLLFTMVAYNVSAPRFDTTPGAFILMSFEGRVFKPLSVGFQMPEPSHTPLSPGGRSHEPAVFEVPSASGALTLIYQPDGVQEIRFEIPPPAELPTEPEPEP